MRCFHAECRDFPVVFGPNILLICSVVYRVNLNECERFVALRAMRVKTSLISQL